MNECCKTTTIPPKVEKILASCSNLPSLPSVVIKIIDASKDPEIGIADVADILSVDPALSAKLLRIANSSMYSRRRKITNLREALSLLGLDAALTISLSFSLVKTLSNNSDSKNNYDIFWRRSILSATIARQIALKLQLPNLEDFFIAGLLQDIGILAIDCTMMTCMDSSCESNHLGRIHCEKNSLGVDHSDVGAWLLKSWDLPEKLYKAVLCSHTIYTTPAEPLEDDTFFRCIGLSGSLAEIWFGKERSDVFERNAKSIKNILGYDAVDLNNFLNQIDETLSEISYLFEMTIIDDKTREEILNESRNILIERNLKSIQQINDCETQIESLTRQSKNIEDDANHDHLTRVYNRKYIEQLLNDEFMNSRIDNQPISLAFIDIDDFKPINDTYGHLTGDKIIQNIASFFTQNIRQTDTIARYGGDEFLIMLPNTTSDTAIDLLHRLVKKLSQQPGTKFNEQYLKVSTSIGVATQYDDTVFNAPEDLINAADKALYNAKRAGKNTVARY